MRQDNS
ncbi:hypothetical protein CGLO_11310 [Colletotrichum gloeosporioides Cg-14]|nr:hypothetical protein CGLO_11310 [Colletotrichum gloeosporioides Cg-14]